MAGSESVPEPLRQRAEVVMASVHGKVPPWLGLVTTPSGMLDQLLVAEGRLRQRYYVGVHLDLEDPA